MEVKAKARFIRMSPKKVRLVVDIIRGMDVIAAEEQLSFSKKAAAGVVLKLLRSAVANAEHNFNLSKDNLYIKTITADDGPTLKRWMPRAFGRATTIRKRSSHINIALEEKVPSQKDSSAGKRQDKKIPAKNKERQERVTAKAAENLDKPSKKDKDKQAASANK